MFFESSSLLQVRKYKRTSTQKTGHQTDMSVVHMWILLCQALVLGCAVT